MEMHAIQPKQASMSSGCIVGNSSLIALRQSCPSSAKSEAVLCIEDAVTANLSWV